jgi:hypothetical protein
MRMRALFRSILFASLSCGQAVANDAPADPRAVMQSIVEQLVEAKPDLRRVEVAGFSARSGYSLCSAALTDALLVALAEEARNPNRVLRDKPLTVYMQGQGLKGGTELVLASGLLDVDAQGKAHISLSFRQGDAVLAPSGRVAVALEKLSCDPAVRPFLDHVLAGARTDRERLDMTAPVFGIGQRLEIAINIKQPLRLYCWVLAEDGTGFVTMPAGGVPADEIPGIRRYPREFRMGEVVVTKPFENLFGCFGVDAPASAPLDDDWVRFGPDVGRPIHLLSADEVRMLMDRMRRMPGVVEALTWVIVR